MSQDTLEITNLESLLGDIAAQEELFAQPMEGVDVTGGIAMSSLPCVTTVTRLSLAKKC